jgi:hypothetical protein
MDRTRKKIFWQGGSVKKKYFFGQMGSNIKTQEEGGGSKRSEKNKYKVAMQMVVEN